MVEFQQAGTAGNSWCFSKSFYLQLPSSVAGLKEEYQVSLDFLWWRRDRIPNDEKPKKTKQNKNPGKKIIEKGRNTKRRLRLCRFKEVLEEVTSAMPFKYTVGFIAWNGIYISRTILNSVIMTQFTIKDRFKWLCYLSIYF